MRRSLFVAILASVPSLAGCNAPPSSQSEPAPKIADHGSGTEPATAQLPVIEQPLGRRDLVLAAMQAASDLAAGTANGAELDALDGRGFSFRIRLCQGGPSRGRLQFDREDSVLRIAVAQDLTGDDPVARLIAPDGVEAVEGFWVPFPWLLQAACPASSSTPQATAPAEPGASGPDPLAEAGGAPTLRPTLGLAQFFGPDTDRSALRQGRPYSVTRPLEGGGAPALVDLVLRGRLARLPGGKVITCINTAAMLPPQCIISVRFDAVRLEHADGTLLAEWSAA